jgi:hypothetical protein
MDDELLLVLLSATTTTPWNFAKTQLIFLFFLGCFL